MEQISGNPEIIREAGLAVTIIVSVIAVCATIVASIAFYKGQGVALSIMLQAAGALQLMTVRSIIAAACFLALLGKVAREGLISLLSGIAGYVLGGYTQLKKDSQPIAAESKQPGAP